MRQPLNWPRLKSIFDLIIPSRTRVGVPVLMLEIDVTADHCRLGM